MCIVLDTLDAISSDVVHHVMCGQAYAACSSPHITISVNPTCTSSKALFIMFVRVLAYTPKHNDKVWEDCLQSIPLSYCSACFY